MSTPEQPPIPPIIPDDAEATGRRRLHAPSPRARRIGLCVLVAAAGFSAPFIFAYEGVKSQHDETVEHGQTVENKYWGNILAGQPNRATSTAASAEPGKTICDNGDIVFEAGTNYRSTPEYISDSTHQFIKVGFFHPSKTLSGNKVGTVRAGKELKVRAGVKLINVNGESWLGFTLDTDNSPAASGPGKLSKDYVWVDYGALAKKQKHTFKEWRFLESTDPNPTFKCDVSQDGLVTHNGGQAATGVIEDAGSYAKNRNAYIEPGLKK